MHRFVGVWFFCLGILAFSETNFQNRVTPVIEARVYDHFLRQFQFSGKEARPVPGQATIYPNVNISIGPKTESSEGQIRIDNHVTLKGNASLTVTKQVLRRRHAGAHINIGIDGHYVKPIYVTADGVFAGRLQGRPNLTSSIQPFNNFRLFHRAVNNRAYSAARTGVNQKLPEAASGLQSTIDSKAQDITRQANTIFRSTLASVNGAFTNPKSFPFSPRLSSQATGRLWGRAQVQFYGTTDPDRGHPPKLIRGNQAATSFKISEEGVEQTLNPELAGKQMKLLDVQRILCQSRLGPQMSFCREKLEKSTAELSLLFVKDNPVRITFDKNQIRLQLNAQYQIHKNPKPDGELLGKPSNKTELKRQTKAYTVEVVYDLTGPEGMKRKSVDVKKYTSPAEKQEEGAHAKKDLFSRSALEDAMTMGALKKAYLDLFKEDVEFPTKKIPLKWYQDTRFQQQPQVSGHGTLHPLETRTEHGWLLSGTYFCPDGMPPLGFRFQPISVSGQIQLQVLSVDPNGPALLAGLRPGDRLTSYRFIEENRKGFTASYRGFSSHVKRAATASTVGKRTLVFEGINNQGRRYETNVAVCP